MKDYYESLGDEVVILTPDFSHRAKALIPASERQEGVVYLPHRPYASNLSIDRLRGHWDFAGACRRCAEELKPQRIHCLLPANSLALQMDRYKKAHPDVQLIFDLNDLWPESLPVHGLQNSFLFYPWKHLRNGHIGNADLVISECQLFAGTLAEYGIPSSVVYWAGSQPEPELSQTWNSDCFEMVYLGSINNIIDIPLICRFIQEIRKTMPVCLHIIGQGENSERFSKEAADAGAEVMFHGVIYDPAKKQEIFSSCRFGLNLMKKDVCIGLSLKSMDYLAMGLPILNSLGADSKAMVEKEGIGLQCTWDNVSQAAARALAMSREENLAMRKRAARAYGARLTPHAFKRRMNEVLTGAGLLSAEEVQKAKTDLPDPAAERRSSGSTEGADHPEQQNDLNKELS